MTEYTPYKSLFTFDLKLMLPVMLLTGIGVAMVFSASSVIALKDYQDSFYFFKKQSIFALAGLFVMIVCSNIPYKIFKHLTYPILIFSVILLLAIQFSGFSHSAGGAARWLRFGSFTIQPAEFARFAMILYLAYSLAKKEEDIKDFYIGFLPHIIILAIFTALFLLQPDFGSVVIMLIITWIMMFVGGIRLLHLTIPCLFILPVAYFLIISSPYRMKRITSFLNPWDYPTTQGYQIIQSLLAFGTGGLLGKGIGQGYQKLFYLPEPHTDFIYSVIGEECGLLGTLAIIILFVLILSRGAVIAANCKDRFGALLATGITASISLQAAVNIGVTLGLLPTKGLVLPFLSYGGSSLIMSMAGIGILINIGENGKKNG
ncbi:MAG: putative lipid II flippase FtsW [Desulfobacteraceae bacterium 4572_19]|nr:MAG: putative lipid II flippase FtsW [Desulfobacteraceae bacterium 4572_19]